MNQSTTRSDDVLFGPQLPGRFDFTLLFEQSIFTALPCSLFLVVAAANIYALGKQPVRVKSGILLWLKLVSHSSTPRRTIVSNNMPRAL